MLFVGDKKRVKSMLKDNARAFSDPENILFGPKYEKMVAKFLSSKNISKGLYKISRIIQGRKQNAALSKRPPI